MDKANSHEILQHNVGMTLIEYFVSSLNKEQDICLFGFGGDGRAIFECLIREGIFVCCICDNQWRREKIHKVVSPDVAVKEHKDALFVVASHKFCYEMELQLLRLGVPKERICSFNESVALDYRGLLPIHAYESMVSAIHYEITGIYPNLKTPETFNEKMMASMILPPMPKKTQLTDKFQARAWIASKIGEKYLIPLIGDWSQCEDIPWDNLPSRYALKMNHGCGWNIISDGKNVIDMAIADRKVHDWFKCNYGYITYERHYIPIQPHIICEEYIENQDNDIYDYKIFCFNGEPKYIMFLSQRKKGLRMAFLDLAWNMLPFVYSFPRCDFMPPKPKRLEEMIALTKVLCSEFDQVRVDWYILNDGSIKFGEMTFTSAGGHAAWDPPEWDLRLGEMLN